MAENKKNSKKGKASTNKVKNVKTNVKTTKKTSTTNNKAKKKNNTTNSELKKVSPKILEEEKNIKENSKQTENVIKTEKEKKANLKQARKQLYYSNKNENDEFSKLFKIVLIVTLIIIVFYGVTVVVTKKAEEATKEANSQKVEIQYDSIMIGSMLNINGSFYVLIEDIDDIRLSEYTTMIQTIKANDDAPTVYTADLSSTFNKAYLSDESNYDSDMEKFKVKGTTLVKIEDHEIVNVYDNYDDIIKKLDELD